MTGEPEGFLFWKGVIVTEEQSKHGCTKIIDFLKAELTSRERKQLEEFMENEQADINDTSCNSQDEIREQILILFEYFRKFMDVVDYPNTKINPDYDFSLALVEGRIKKIRGMLKNLFRD